MVLVAKLTLVLLLTSRKGKWLLTRMDGPRMRRGRGEGDEGEDRRAAMTLYSVVGEP